MTNVLPFKRPSAKQKHKGKTLCKSGFHKWRVVTHQQFDTKQGKLVTRSKCERCGQEKVEAR
jgi:formate dehydrogenase assembly factor FdhD